MVQHRLEEDLKGASFIDTATDTGILDLQGHGKMIGWGDTVPADGSTGWGKAAIFFHTNGANADDLIYENSGDTTSSTFVSVTSVAGGDFGATGMKADVVAESTAATGVTVDGVLSKDGAVTASGDVAAGDNATLGYTATEGAVLTGQGSTNDITLKNDAKAIIMAILTGTINADFKGDVNVLAAKKFAGAGSTIVGLMPAAAQQALSGAGAVTITEYYTAVTNTGSDALTLVDGAQVGQLKKITMIVDPGTDSTLTPSNLSGGTTIVFADVGDFCILMWDGTNWVAVELGNDADGATAPVLA